MKKRITFICTICVVMYIILSSFGGTTDNTLSTGAPPGHTGAPGEQTCARSGCHDTYSVNSGIATTNILFNNGNNFYEPGKTYSVIVTISENNINRFGFELTALTTMNSQKSGKIILTDTNRTQINNGTNQFFGREYITYRYYGTTPVSQGLGKWSFEWKAPPNNEGKITLYLATVSANNDATDEGDYAYITSLEVEPMATVTANDFLQNNSFGITIYPNPGQGLFNIIASDKGPITKVEVFDYTGKLIFLPENKINVEKQTIDISGKPVGLYYLKITSARQEVVKKIVLSN
jgi:hypothetical protein